VNNNDNDTNNFGRLLALLLLSGALCSAMFYLPDSIGGMKVKRVDLLADLRRKEAGAALMDSLRNALIAEDTTSLPGVDSASLLAVAAPTLPPEVLAERDSLYALLNAEGRDSTLIPFEDYSAGRTGLSRFCRALRRAESEGGSVRIAFLGDSFIEGDILVGDFRHELQKRFGGRGVGFVPIASVAAQFRPTVTAKETGWTTYSILKQKGEAYTPAGCFFRPTGDEASVAIRLTGYNSTLAPVDGVKLLYHADRAVETQLIADGDTALVELPPTDGLGQYVYRKSGLRGVNLRVTGDAESLRTLGLVMESERGVSVDNFSIRGNSGLLLGQLNQELCLELNAKRPYDLLVLQYGLNVVVDSTLSYSWYAGRMVGVIDKLKRCFPGADIILMGVSDRSRQVDGAFETMPAVLALLHAQRKLAKQTGVVFWNTFAAMGGENSMVRFVDNNWAAKDYTHLSYRGGREISDALVKAVMHEKRFYDKID
jgi:hypothetical protein